MSTILSQSEIDALLSQLNTGEDVAPIIEEESAQDVRVYDFRTANKFSKEQMRTMHTIFDNFASVLSTRLTGLLRTLCEVSVVSVEEQLFGEFNNSIPMPSIISIINAPPLKGSFIFQMSSSVAYGIISCLFGGTPDYTDQSKPFSEIDLAIMGNIFPQMLRIFGEAWEKVAKLTPRLDRIETSPQFTQIIEANEPSALITLNAKMGTVEDMITICLPHLLLQPISKQINSMAWTLGDRKEGDHFQDPIVQAHVLNTKVMLRARFNKSMATVNDLLHLKKGDILLTGHRIDEFIMMDVEQIPKFQVVLGVNEGQRVVQIAKIIKEREDIE